MANFLENSIIKIMNLIHFILQISNCGLKPNKTVNRDLIWFLKITNRIIWFGSVLNHGL